MSFNLHSVAAYSIATLSLVLANAVPPANAAEWRFTVLLDGKPIGYHHYRLNERGAERELLSEARFRVKFLFIDAYRYAHDNRELWRDDCLQTVSARTDDNGARNSISGFVTAKQFAVIKNDRRVELGPCVMSFAYWNPQILGATRLLNSQTGEYVPIRVTKLGAETLTVRGNSQPADRYRVIGDATVGGKLQIDLWYSANRDWLRLESTTNDGRHLTYQIQ